MHVVQCHTFSMFYLVFPINLNLNLHSCIVIIIPVLYPGNVYHVSYKSQLDFTWYTDFKLEAIGPPKRSFSEDIHRPLNFYDV